MAACFYWLLLALLFTKKRKNKMTKQHKIILIVVALLIAAIAIYSFVRKFILNIKGAVNTTNDVLIQQTADNNLAANPGIPPERLATIKDIAKELSKI